MLDGILTRGADQALIQRAKDAGWYLTEEDGGVAGMYEAWHRPDGEVSCSNFFGEPIEFKFGDEEAHNGLNDKDLTAKERKQRPICTGVLDYFPDALMEVAACSAKGNEQHHANEPLHWDKSKSTDEADALVRHLLERGKRDTDGIRHTAKVVWRALALLQREIDSERSEDWDRGMGDEA